MCWHVFIYHTVRGNASEIKEFPTARSMNYSYHYYYYYYICMCRGLLLAFKWVCVRERQQKRVYERKTGKEGKKKCAYLWASGCCKHVWKRGEGGRGRWIALCSVVLGRRGDWGWRLEIATGDQVIQSFKWLWENQSNQHTLSLTHSFPPDPAHTRTQSYVHNAFGWVEFALLLISFHVAWMRQTSARVHAHAYTHWFLVWNLIRLALSWMTDAELSVSNLNS